MTVRLEHSDCLKRIPRLVADGVVVDSVVTDPPYHMLPTSKRFAPGQKQPGDVQDGRYNRLLGGFMGSTWDGGDLAFRPETWATVATILRRGGFLLAFGGTRTAHRMVCAIEDAGFIIQDTIAWLYGSGFPKARDMLKPAFEPIVVAYKPGGKRTLQVGECRVPAPDGVPKFTYRGGPATHCYGDGLKFGNRTGAIDTITGRWPANVCHSGDDEVMEAFAAFGERSSGVLPVGTRPGGKRNTFGNDRKSGYETTRDFGGDTGSVARFFYCAKADAQDRWGSKHPTVKPIELMKWLVPLVTPQDGWVLDPFAGSGTTGIAAMATGRNAILIEREDQYAADIRQRLAFYDGAGLHSLVSKNRNARELEALPLFAAPDA
jgi:site-specific DNA-methyltransferase (adenine-specific)